VLAIFDAAIKMEEKLLTIARLHQGLRNFFENGGSWFDHVGSSDIDFKPDVRGGPAPGVVELSLDTHLVGGAIFEGFKPFDDNVGFAENGFRLGPHKGQRGA